MLEPSLVPEGLRVFPGNVLNRRCNSSGNVLRSSSLLLVNRVFLSGVTNLPLIIMRDTGHLTMYCYLILSTSSFMTSRKFEEADDSAGEA